MRPAQGQAVGTSPAPVSTLRRVAAATVHYGLASVLPRIVNFALIPVFAIFLPPEELGVLEIATALMVLMQTVSRLGLTGSLARQYFDHRGKDSARDLFTTIAAIALVSSGLAMGLVLVVGPPIFQRFIPEVVFHPAMDLALVTAFLQFGPELQTRVLQAREHSRLAASITIVLSIIGTALKVVFVIGLRWGVLGVLWGELFTALAALVIAVWLQRDDLRGRIRWDLGKEALAYGTPLILQGLGAWAQDYGGRWILGAMGVLAAVGQLGLAARIASPIVIATSAFISAFSPVYFAWRTDLSKDAALAETRKTTVALMTILSVGALGAGTVGAFFLGHLMPDSYRDAMTLVGFIAAGLQIRVMYNIFGTELLYANNTKAMSVIFIVGAAATLLFTIALVPPLGAVGAALGQVCGTAIMVLSSAIYAKRSFPLAVSPRLLLATIFAAVAASAGPYLLPGASMLVDLLAAIGLFLAFALACLLIAGFSRATVKRAMALRRGALQGAAES
jgi:O-antigen/teichoic acid export membrane protein